ncbi:MAG: tRNA uridine-5-carboxymethylaminomethyl(34) synthesis GTPase MnmE, partial [Gammaproteobacteria bacterium]|nr:tRNA uridine-5-carboxymethylaminomethyl(34) synthesis GTPase MnmE [Gammaproteobacteria bacterium]
MKTEDTIAAIATPPGRGGIGVVRMSGPQAKNIASKISKQKLSPRVATFSVLKTAQAETIDEGLVIFFPGPHSFTGEDVIEFQCHGSPVVLDSLLQEILTLGARLARPGEFSERAFLNNKLDLTQAEAIADLIDAGSVQAARLAIRSLQGEFSKLIHQLQAELTELRMYVEAAIDFPEEEVDFLKDSHVQEKLIILVKKIKNIQQQAAQSTLMQEGLSVVIVGKPNVGKSSLLNCLSGKEAAIVTDIAGTTRDSLREYIHIDGLPLHIVDTAGLRLTEDVVEQEGIKRAWAHIEQADLVLLMVEAPDIT